MNFTNVGNISILTLDCLDCENMNLFNCMACDGFCKKLFALSSKQEIIDLFFETLSGAFLNLTKQQ